jgi:hypothetical protein
VFVVGGRKPHREHHVADDVSGDDTVAGADPGA